MIRNILIAIAVLIFIALIAVFVVHRKISSAGAKPLDIQNPAEVPEVKASLERRLAKVEPPQGPPGAAPAATPSPTAGREEKLPITADELSALLDRLIPNEGLKFKVGVANGLAHVQLSVPAAEVTKLGKDQLGPAASYIDGSMKWVNVDMLAAMALADGKLTVTVKEVRQPPFLTVGTLQPILDNMLAQRPPGPVQSMKGDPPFELTGLQLEGDSAVVTIRRLSK
jgi:hypothetical protein